MKIGRTIQLLEKRLGKLPYKGIFGEFEIDFLMAIEGHHHEFTLLNYFDKYRARYQWYEKGKRTEDLTYPEAWSRSIQRVRAEQGMYTESKAADVYRKHVRVTRLELFKIPPRKVGSRLKDLIIKVLN